MALYSTYECIYTSFWLCVCYYSERSVNKGKLLYVTKSRPWLAQALWCFLSFLFFLMYSQRFGIEMADTSYRNSIISTHKHTHSHTLLILPSERYKRNKRKMESGENTNAHQSDWVCVLTPGSCCSSPGCKYKSSFYRRVTVDLWPYIIRLENVQDNIVLKTLRTKTG